MQSQLIQTQLIINRFNIPKEVSEHIKDFLFSLITKRVRRIKNIMCASIRNSFWTPKRMDSSDNVYMFRVGKLSFFIPFCPGCGNYVITWNTYRQRLRSIPIVFCRCNKIDYERL